MNEILKNNYKEIKKTIDSNKLLKTAVYIGIGVVALYVLGKALSSLASTVRGFNELKSALNGK